MRDRFLKAIVEALIAAGFDAKVGYMFLTVNGVDFNVDYNSKHKVVRFLDSNFSFTAAGNFDLTRAVGLLIKALPKRLEAAKRDKARVEHRTALREWVDAAEFKQTHARDYVDLWEAAPGFELTSTADGIEVRITVASVEEARAILEKLAPKAEESAA